MEARATLQVTHIGFDALVMINAEDFDPSVHSVAEDKKPAKKAKAE